MMNPGKKWFILGIPFISIVGSIMHFVYAWSGNNSIVGIFAPINESVWEHLKMTFWTTLFWWLFWYFMIKRSRNVSTARWFTACAVSIVICPLFITSFYYTYTGALGIHSLLLDISSLFIGVILAQIAAMHIYRFTRPKGFALFCSIIIILLPAAAFVLFTFFPPNLPLFKVH